MELNEINKQFKTNHFKNIYVYIASAYTLGDTGVNVKTQIDMSNKLMELGIIPFVPLLSHFLHMAHPKPYEIWTDYDLKWLLKCDCLLRINNGKSKGADLEEFVAKLMNIPIFYSIEELLEYYELKNINE